MSSDYDLLRQRLDDQLRADIEMIYTAYLAKVRACETLAAGQVEAGGRPPLALGGAFPALPGQTNTTLLLAAAPAPAGPPALPPAPAPPAPVPPVQRRRPKAANHAVYNAVLAALERVPEVFDKNDLLRFLPVKPHRGTLFRVLETLVNRDKVIVEEDRGGFEGGPSRYRKLPPAPTGAGEPAGPPADR